MNPRAGQRRVNLSKPRIDESPWEGVPECWQDKLGFIYVITHKETGKFYVGKKLFWKAAPKMGSRKTFEESDWRKYWSSSKELQDDIKKFGKNAFSRRIIATADTKSVLSMIELHYQLNWCVQSDNTYNGIINIRSYLHPKVKQGYRDFIVNDNINVGLFDEVKKLQRENARLRNRITTEALADALVQAYVIPPSAIEDPNGYYGYATLDSIAEAASILSNAVIHP